MTTLRSMASIATSSILVFGALACSDDDAGGTEDQVPAAGGSAPLATGGTTTATGGNSVASGGSTAASTGGMQAASTGGMASGGTPSGGAAAGGAPTGGGDGGGSGGNDGSCSTILEAAAATPELSSLVSAVEAAGISAALMADDLTVFAPDNEAFSDLLDALGIELGDLTADQLVPILTYHVADSVVPSSTALQVAQMEENTFGTLGGTITLDLQGEALVIDSGESAATVTTPDIEACNGVVHMIDAVLLPSITDIVVSQDAFSGLETLIGAADASEVDVAMALDGPSISESADAWTLFAPNNDAVDALLGLELGLSEQQVTAALLYHAYPEGMVLAADALGLDTSVPMASGEMLSIAGDAEAGTVTLTDALEQEAQVVITNLYAQNGVIHVIDTVLVPQSIADSLAEE